MKKILTSGFLLIIPYVYGFSQDTIFLRSGENIKAKVLEVNQAAVKYKKYAELDGQNFFFAKGDVSTIHYENGTIDVFKEVPKTPAPEKDVDYESVNKFPNGIYMTLEQLRKRKPTFDADFTVIRRTQGDIGMNGGNDYEIKSTIDSINKKFIKKTMVAYVRNDSVFINCIHYGIGTWYALSLSHGPFLTFKGCMSSEQSASEVSPYGMMFGAIGGGLAGASAAKKRFPYVLSLRTGNVKSLNKGYLQERLKEKPNLLNQFNTERDQESEFTLFNYVKLLDRVTPLD